MDPDIEIRQKVHREPNQFGKVRSAFVERPFVSVVHPRIPKNARAVRINGKWYCEAVEPYVDVLARDWEKLRG